jgi:hypothetical protein
MTNSLKVRSDFDNTYVFKIFLIGLIEEIKLPDCYIIDKVEKYIDSRIIKNITTKYTPSETCWILKSFIFDHLITEKYDYIFYLDSDIYFYGCLCELFKEINNKSILLTPHYLYEYPDDSCTPSDLTLLRAGIFNAGFIGVSNTPTAQRFLHWWQSKTLKFGRNDPNKGMCGDQKWLDLVPILFEDVKICRHKGFNVAYWNLHERPITISDGIYYCDNEPLIFFHFSGFNIIQKSILKLSHHSNRMFLQSTPEGFINNYQRKVNKKIKNSTFLNKKYKYEKWWHKKYKFYRKIFDSFSIWYQK